ncbi:MAG: twin-arginine translocase subunit TatC [Actinomycetia bacterium]|nr:twin-arginine translocase subunit TatC [Actinomycetes bacterium]
MRLPRRLGHGDEVSLSDHLGELRQRIIISVAAVAVAFGVAYGFRKDLIGFLMEPLPDCRVRDEGGECLEALTGLTLSPAEPFLTSLTVALWAAMAVALPILLWQIWNFVAPAFERPDQRMIGRLLMMSTGLFAAGIAFAYFVVLPAAIPFLLGYDSDIYDIQLRARDYLGFVWITLIAVGLVFQMPMVLLGLVRLRILTADKLRRNRRIGIAVSVAVAVLLPGVDPMTTIIEAVPLLLLFELSIWMAVFFEKRWIQQAAEAAAAEADDAASQGLAGTSEP